MNVMLKMLDVSRFVQIKNLSSVVPVTLVIVYTMKNFVQVYFYIA